MPQELTASLHKTAFDVMDQWLCWRAEFSGLPGFQASIRHQGDLVFSKAYGFANLLQRKKYTPKHLGHLASHSKILTTCAALSLSSAGAFSLDDKAALYLPWLNKHHDRRFKDITLHHLLTNRSGLFRDGIDASFWELEKPFLNREKLRAEIMSSALVYKPGTVSKYSNMGFALLGLVMESVMERPYDDIVSQLVLGKLLKHHLMPDYHPSREALFADGHSLPFYNGEKRAFKHVRADGLACATGLCGNTDDASLLVYEYLNGKTLMPRKWQRELRQTAWEMANAPGELYGIGLQINTLGGHRYIGHTGGFPGFSSQTRLVDGGDYVFSFILNTNRAITLSIVQGMAGIIHKLQESFTPAEMSGVEVTKPLINKWGAYLYVAGKNRIVSFDLESWNPAAAGITIDKRGGKFIADKATGWNSVGEEYAFIRKNGKISHLKVGAYHLYQRAEFVRRTSESLQK